ncbi:nucleotidyltransferase domain-containing protein [Streptomyces sp. t39]|uniref:nucleotidyltransferase domain-containing protein n=1 Tax=Streptomyces sp. t39 TaxID=1828156 RepID=UPI003967C2BD
MVAVVHEPGFGGVGGPSAGLGVPGADPVVDVLAAVFTGDGSAVQESPDPRSPFPHPASCFVTGTVRGTPVACLSAEQQVFFHQGYGPAERDRQGVARLRTAFGVATGF